MPIAAAKNPSFLSCSTWSCIKGISGEKPIIVEFSKVRAALAKRGNSWKIKLLPKPVGIIAKTSLPWAKSQTLFQSTRQRGFIKSTCTSRVGHLGDDKLMIMQLSINCHNWRIRVCIRSLYTGTGGLKKCVQAAPPCLFPAPVRFSHFLFLKDFSPPSQSLEQAKLDLKVCLLPL